jgi:epoxyqueuosine reductase
MLTSRKIKEIAAEFGFSKCGIAAARKLPKSDFLSFWFNKGMHGEMGWMENYLDKRLDIRKLYPDAKSVISLAINYYSNYQHSEKKNKAKISRYAWSKDYHKILKKRIKLFYQALKKNEKKLSGSIFVDTAPVQDKLWAEQAGIGWQGKNTNIITREYGSWIFLGGLALNIELEADKLSKDYCGNCTKCIDACPTNALKPYQLDARKCISYLTIEYWDKEIPPSFQNKLNNWIFGCDICQDVCPWNRNAQSCEDESFAPIKENIQPNLNDLLELSEVEFKKRYQKTPVYRAKYQNFIRNVKTVFQSEKE